MVAIDRVVPRQKNYYGMSCTGRVLRSILLRTFRICSPTASKITPCMRWKWHFCYQNGRKMARAALYNGRGQFAICVRWKSRYDLEEVVDSKLEAAFGNSAARTLEQVMIVG